MGTSAIQLGESLIDSFVSTIQNNPLQEGEIRLVEGVGEVYIALTTTNVDDVDGIVYTEQYKFTIDDIGYTIYARL